MGVITPTCDAGYAVTSEEVRKVLEICGSWAWHRGGLTVFHARIL